MSETSCSIYFILFATWLQWEGNVCIGQCFIDENKSNLLNIKLVTIKNHIHTQDSTTHIEYLVCIFASDQFNEGIFYTKM